MSTCPLGKVMHIFDTRNLLENTPCFLVARRTRGHWTRIIIPLPLFHPSLPRMPMLSRWPVFYFFSRGGRPLGAQRCACAARNAACIIFERSKQHRYACWTELFSSCLFIQGRYSEFYPVSRFGHFPLPQRNVHWVLVPEYDESRGLNPNSRKTTTEDDESFSRSITEGRKCKRLVLNTRVDLSQNVHSSMATLRLVVCQG